jgi:hypothetical protein
MTHDGPGMRASDNDRERAADVLKAALAEGRLDFDEHRARLDRLMRSDTYGEMQQLIGDLPTSGVPFPLTAPGQLVHPTQAAVNPWATPYQPYAHSRQQTEGLASASLILGILTPFCGVSGIPAIVTGHLALSRIRENGTQGKGLAIGGLVLGYLFTTFFVLAVIAGILGS